jgi:succinate dehydrogenase flavin-adding protein (antitoxin of CptAB toxin-antitoxin module)
LKSLEEIAQEWFEEVMAMDDEEFMAWVDEHSKGDIAQLLYYGMTQKLMGDKDE